MKYKKFGVVSLAIFILIATVYVGVTGTLGTSQSMLSVDELSSLRNTYPFYDDFAPSLSIIATRSSMESILKPCELVIVGEVIAELEPYQIDIITDKDSKEYKLKEKLKENNWNNFGFQSYTPFKIKVLDTWYGDSSIKEVTGITVTDFVPYEPFKENLKGVFYLKSCSEPNEGKYWVGKPGFFYLTDDNVVLSAISDETYNKYSGWKLKDFKKEILAIKER